MAALPELQSVTQLSRYVTRILGANPSKFTLQGTNSYIVHHPSSPHLLLIDTTGPSSASALPPSALQTYLTSLRTAILSHPLQPAFITDIILTHWHKDHVGAVQSVVELLGEMQPGRKKVAVKVWKMPCSVTGTGEAWKGEEEVDLEIGHSLEELEGSNLCPTEEGKMVHTLQDGQRFRLGRPPMEANLGEDAIELEVVSTPGHTSDSICLSLSLVPPGSPPTPASSASSTATAPDSSRLLALFTADSVLGHGTAVFASLSSYLRSLSSLLDLLKGAADGGRGDVLLYPGHGEMVQKGLQKVQEYKSHREERERQVVEGLQKVAEGENVTASELTDQIYASSIPASLKPAATHGLLLHLAKLEEDGLVERIPRTEEVEQQTHGEVVIPKGWNDGWTWVGGSESSVVAGPPEYFSTSLFSPDPAVKQREKTEGLIVLRVVFRLLLRSDM
ncbi:hypothetical protein JCM11251_006000 [Rhodosporidiobolus azoricus]